VQRVRTVAMNDRGDITGYSDDLNGHQNVLLWKAGSSTYQTLGAGMPVGIDEDGRVAITGGVIVNPDGTRRALQLPSDVGRVTLSSFEHGMIAGYGFTSSGWSGIVWDATGALVSNVSGAFARSANSHGTMLGQNGTSSADVAVWRGGVLSEYVTNPQPSFSISGSVNSGYGTITDDDVIISDDVNGAPTRWHCQ
jgi:hypothetical protein